ncbi:hypothetical protein IR010_05770 [Flavobacterium sp. MR2016-29]|uniref:hypothetical protein n=1 Tax=Flavobacterium sp. MR2016-29 TaxID=2783795 RepID=UPI00188C16F2|nr:hypothetical protein [Flavobacterium sp. MR2016-29]MBF4492045.1 hypothetical protein [Flavobacterium sp. MR2016-29]
MKNIFNHFKKLIIPALGLLVFTSCGDENDQTPYQTKDGIANASNVKFVHAAVGPNGTNFQINYFTGTEKISAVGVTTGVPIGMSYGAQYPIPINYVLMKPGTQPLKIVTPTTPAVTIFDGNIVTETGKYYTSFLLSTPPSVTPPVYSVYQLNDDLSVADLDKTKAYIRFINVISNSVPAGYDLGLIKETSIAGATPVTTQEIYTYRNVTFKGGSEKYIAIEPQDPKDTRGYQLQVRVAGSPTNVPGTITGTTIANLANSPASAAFIPRAGRVYTIYCRGIIGGLPTATLNAPSVTFITNK